MTRHAVLCAFLCSSFVTALSLVSAQLSPADQKKFDAGMKAFFEDGMKRMEAMGYDRRPLSQQLGKPTGLNGLEELAKAHDIAFADTERSLFRHDATMDEKRRIVAEPRSKEIFGLIERGLAKPIMVPVTKSPAWPSPAMTVLRQMSYILAMRQEVNLADGKFHEAAKALSLGIKLADPVRSLNIGGWFNADGILQRLWVNLRDRLSELSDADCSTLLHDARAYALKPKALIATLKQDCRQSVAGWSSDNRGKPDKAKARILEVVAADYDYVIQNVEKPISEWSNPPRRAADSDRDKLLAGNRKDTIRFAQVLLIRSGRARMLGLHIAIELYRKAHNRRLPATLAELNIGDLAIEPATGKPFLYSVSQDGKYTLRNAAVEPKAPVMSE